MKMKLLGIACAACLGASSLAGLAQSQTKKPLLSPPAETSQTVDGKTVSIKYSAPSVRGRKIFGGLVPYDKVWRTGANAATTLKTEANLKIGTATVPAGTYTLYTLPSEGTWKLIINKQTGQWGTVYKQDQDLARVDMKKETLPAPQEVMSITLEPFHGKSSSLHVRWETTDVSVPVKAQ
jgi:ABC-type oligopeptide transport system substrate-binding subunit